MTNTAPVNDKGSNALGRKSRFYDESVKKAGTRPGTTPDIKQANINKKQTIDDVNHGQGPTRGPGPRSTSERRGTSAGGMNRPTSERRGTSVPSSVHTSDQAETDTDTDTDTSTASSFFSTKSKGD